MIPQGRPFFALVTVVVLIIFFLAGPFSAKPAPVKRISNADARLARWIEVVSPPGKPFRPAHAYDSPMRQPVRDQSRPLVAINLYPLGKPEANPDDYLNANKRGRNPLLEPGSSSSQAQTTDEINMDAPHAQTPAAVKTPSALRKAPGAGLSPLDKLPPAHPPVVATPVAGQQNNAASGLSPHDKVPASKPVAGSQPENDDFAVAQAPPVRAAVVNDQSNAEPIVTQLPVKANAKLQNAAQATPSLAAANEDPTMARVGSVVADSAAPASNDLAAEQGGAAKSRGPSEKLALNNKKPAVKLPDVKAADATSSLRAAKAPLVNPAGVAKAGVAAVGQPPVVNDQSSVKAATATKGAGAFGELGQSDMSADANHKLVAAAEAAPGGGTKAPLLAGTKGAQVVRPNDESLHSQSQTAATALPWATLKPLPGQGKVGSGEPKAAPLPVAAKAVPVGGVAQNSQKGNEKFR